MRLLRQEEKLVVLKPGWLPETDWPELEALRADHERLLTGARQARGALGDVRAAHLEEDEARAAAARAGARAGTKTKLPKLTSPEARQKALAPAEEAVAAAEGALLDFCAEAIEQLKTLGPELGARLRPVYAEAEQKREEARRLLAEADADVRSVQRTSKWIQRNSGTAPGMPASFLIAWDDMHVAPPEEPIDLVNILGHGGVISNA